MSCATQDSVIKQLHEWFGGSLNFEVIKSVASRCQYNMELSLEELMEISSTIGAQRPNQLSFRTNNDFTNKRKIQQSSSTGTLARKSKKALEIENAIREIGIGYKVLIILRGMPGSGKSFLGRKLVDSTVATKEYDKHIYSTDDFFKRNNQYCFDPNRLNEAHGWNHQRVFYAAAQGISPIIIDNTNTQMWDMKPYVQIAADNGYIIEILEPDTHWSFNDKELAKRNVHGVPKQKIRDMIDRYDKNVTVDKLLYTYKITYPNSNKAPKLRKYPPLNKPSDQNISKSKSATHLNKDMQASKETFNLMEFYDEEPKKECKKDPWTENSNVDKLLQINDSSDPFMSLFPSIETAWGINETALRSWEIVKPIKDIQEFELKSPSIAKAEIQVQSKETGTNTDQNDMTNPTAAFKILPAFSRDINFGVPLKSFGIPKKIMIDKSCLTETTVEDHCKELAAMFPSKPSGTLSGVLARCNGDLELAIEVLLDLQGENLDNWLQEEENETEAKAKVEETPKVEIKKEELPKTPNEDLEELKKQIEEKVDIGSSFYSDHVLKVKQRMFGAYQEEPISNSFVKLSLDEDDDFKEEEIIEINLGDVCVEQLETRFGDPNMFYPKGFQPVVSMPVNLARQLYTFYIESVYQQMEAQEAVIKDLVKQDEEFAKRLQDQECLQEELKDEACGVSFKSIIKEQAAASAQQREIDKWRNLTPNDLAAKLTKQKLVQAFPSVEENLLVEILYAHNNNYQETVNTLLASTGQENLMMPLEKVIELPINAEVVNEMQNAYESKMKLEQEDSKDAKGYRDEASRLYKKREDLFEKAQAYYKRKMPEVALFYSDLAAQLTQQFEKANNLAAEAFLEEHAKRLQDFNTLDLHYLHVKEALAALDIYLDRCINLLIGSKKNNEILQIITGRGKRSENGLSKLRPAVENHLRKRKLQYNILNPGMLKVKINQNSLLTNNLR